MYLSPWDWAVVAVYAIVILAIGLRAGRNQHTSEGYFLAGRRLKWPFIGASIYAANISTEHFVGLAGCGYVTGLAFGCYEWIAVFCLIPLIVLFLPFYMKNRIYTVPEFLERRFGPSVRLAFSAFMVLLSVLAKISISLWAASLVFHEVLGWDQMAVIWGVGLATALYTMKGGLSAVVFTDALQTAVLILAAVVMTGIGLYHVGGYEALRARLDPSMFSMVKPATDPDLPWPGVFIGVFLLGTFYFSMDQVLVQRVFAAKNLNEGRLGATFCAFLKTLNPIILVGPGLIAAALYPGLAKGDLAYPTMLKSLMPTGLLGLTVAGITAALMGHLSATYNSVATLITRDFYLKWRPEADQNRQIRVGRIAVLTVFILGAAWAPLIGRSASMFIYLQKIQAYLMIPFAGVFLFAIFWKRTNTAGVLACMAATLVLSPVMMLNNEMHFLPLMDHPYLRPWLHGAMLMSALCMVVLAVVSLLTPPPPAEKLVNTTVASLWSKDAASMAADEMLSPRVAWYKDYRLWLSIVSAGTALAWYIMR
jgi:solute:Na+ symporter, SSS family